MAAKVDQASAVDSRRTVSTSASPKISIFGAKSGFVIPKNKLSGSLVPANRGAGKSEANDTSKEESTTKQVQRKTKWGIDLMQDAAVRRGRALAYQTRVEQITQQLESGNLKVGDDEALRSPSPVQSHESSAQQTENKLANFELLDLERREAIGEILRLNPSYKAPLDYRPVLREAKVPIPLKAYPGYNFIGLILGPESNTQKRLEEETGTKIGLHGTKADTGEKVEISQSDGNEAQGIYEELYVHVSADTFEKVDAAVALIELLVTPVSGNSAAVSTTSTLTSEDGTNILDQSQEPTVHYMMPMAAVNQGGVPPMMMVGQPGPQRGQFQAYPGPWHPLGPRYALMRPPPSGFMFSAPNSTHLTNNPIRFPPTTMAPFNAPPFFRGRLPAAAGGFGPGSRPQPPPMQAMQRPYLPEARAPNQIPPPRSHPMSGSQLQPTYPAGASHPNPGLSAPFLARQPMQSGPPPPPARPPMASMPPPVSPAPSGPPPNRSLVSIPHPGSSSGWSGAPLVSPSRPGNMFQTPPPSMPPQGQFPALAQPAVARANAPVTSVCNPQTANAILPGGYRPQPSTTQLAIPPFNRPNTMAFASVPPPIAVGSVLSQHAQIQCPAPAMGLAPALTPAPAATSLPLPLPPPTPRPLSMPAPASPAVFTRAAPPMISAPAPSLVRAPSPVRASSSAAAPQLGSIRAPPMPSATPAQGLVQASAPVPLISVSPQPTPPRAAPAASSISASLPSFSPASPPPITSPVTISPVTAPKPQRPSSGDFTFQPLKPQIPAPTAASTTIQNAPPPMPSPRTNSPAISSGPAIPPPTAPQAPSFRPAVHNLVCRPSGMLDFPRPAQAANRTVQPPLPQPPPGSAIPFSATGSPPVIRPPSITATITPRPQTFPNPHPVASPISVPRMGPPSFRPAPQMPNVSHLSIRPVNLQQLQQNQVSPGNHPGFLVPNHPIGSSNIGYNTSKLASSPSGGNQIYDPFSPTSISSAHPQQGDQAGKVKKPESDAEYEDLMASVGVR